MMKALVERGLIHASYEPNQENLALLFGAWEAAARADEEFNDYFRNHSPKETAVRVGQVWQDNDTRQRNDPTPRRGKVVKIFGGFATVEWNTGRTTQVSLKRFRPNSTGYKLIKDVLDGHAIGALALGWPNPRQVSHSPACGCPDCIGEV